MATQLKLSRLPKAGRLRSIKFRRTTPGSIERLIAPHSVPAREEISPDDVINPSHPWAPLHPFKFLQRVPCFRTPWITIHAFPKALLGVPEKQYQENTPFALRKDMKYGKDGKVEGGRKSVNMSLMFGIGKKNVHKFSAVRNKIKRKVKIAMMLMVTRDAIVEEVDVENGKSKEREGEEETIGKVEASNGSDHKVISSQTIVQSGTSAGERWILQDWTYVVKPSLEIYRMPMPTLLAGIQKALRLVNAAARKLEYVWKLEAVATARRQGIGSTTTTTTTNAKSSSSSRSTSTSGNGRTRTGEIRDDKKRQWATSVSHVRTLLKPYVKENAEVIDEDLLPEKNDEREGEDEGEHSNDGGYTALESRDRPGMIRTRLPPRRTAENPEEDEDKPLTTLETLLSTPAPTSDSTPAPSYSETQPPDDESEAVSDHKGPSFVKAMYSRGPILKPVVISKQEQEEKEKEKSKKGRERGRTRTGSGSGFPSKLRSQRR